MAAPAGALLPEAGVRQTIIFNISVAILVSESDVRWRVIQADVRLAAWFSLPT